jgi:hypothetical protein
MEKVKIFTQGTSDEFEDLEEKVNAWFAENEGVEIVDRQAVSSAGVNVLEKGFVNCTIVIFYQTKKA